MNKFYRYAVKAVFFCLLCTVFSCSSKQKNTEVSNQLIVGLSQIGNESSWRMCNTRSIKEAAEKAGIQLIIDDARQKQENQIKAIRSFIVYQVDVILLVPIVESGWETVLKEARDAHIPVIIVDRKVNVSDKSLYECFIGEDGVEEGRKAGRFLVEKYKDCDKKLNILELGGTENSSIAFERSIGFREIIRNNPKFDIIYSENGDFLKSRGREIVSKIISYNGGELKIGTKIVDIIYSQNDAMTLGALEALDFYNIKSGSDVSIVTVDGEQQAIDALKAGKLNCVVECNPYIGDNLMALVKAVNDRTPIPACTYVEEAVFTENDDLSAVATRGY